MLVALPAADPDRDKAFPDQTSPLAGKKIGGTNAVPAALAKPFQLMQAGDIGGVFGGTGRNGPDVCPVAVMQKMFAGHGASLRMGEW